MQRTSTPELAPSFDTPLELLHACHDKVRRFAGLTLKLQQHVSKQGADDEAQQAARNVLRYFEQAAPLHHLDEEQDLFPALLALGDPALNHQIEALQLEHEELAQLWQQVRSWLVPISQGQAVAAPAGLTSFAERYPAHALREEQLVYPAARKLTEAQLNAIGQSMRARRGA